jgi:hypothetical protein
MLPVLLILFFPVKQINGADFFVHNGTGTDCSMADPCHFSLAQTNASNGDTIYFKTGTYAYTGSHLVTDLILVLKSLSLQGGWNGASSGPIVKDPEAYPTILDGSNVRRVVKINGPISPTIEGFTIENGNAPNTLSIICSGVNTTGCGGGIYVYLADALIKNNKILNNRANDGQAQGGGIHLEKASGTIVRNNLFQGNTAGLGGGVSLYGSASTSPQIINNRFVQNSAASGGAIGFFDQTDPTIQDNHFENNTATNMFGVGIMGWGNSLIAGNHFQNNLGNSVVTLVAFQGSFNANQLLNNTTSIGLYLLGGALPYPVVSNNFIVRSGSLFGLAAVGETIDSSLSAVIEHNTLVGEGIGTGIAAAGYCTLSVNNNIISGFPNGIKMEEAPALVIARHTLFDDSVTTHGTNVNFVNTLVGDPGFKDPVANGFHIKLASAARDAGTANFITTTQDIDGDPRPIGSAPDIGADEINPSFLYLPLIKK